ncbi:hypothetical protein [Amycolatopsis minnesotensis]|uniref:Excreted virulence factor EspC (Type VII ESX diderm) n=1 Tax=Amycolatopsis minnesotensis TaxID=337894 RepID=A0ABN2Q4P6_9PSEU
MTGFDVDPQDLRDAAGAIRRAVDAADLHLDAVPDGSVSRALGHEGAFAALAQFCGTWQTAAGDLRKRALDHAADLVTAAKSYEESDRQVVLPGGDR